MINFDLPSELIAQKPAHPRDHARLLVYSRSEKTIRDSYFYELPKFLVENTTLVLNNSKVENCRWLFGKMEVFVLNKLDTHTVKAMVRPGKKFKLGSRVELAPGIEADVLDIDQDGFRTLKLSVQHDSELLKKYEHIPLPPYIEQNDSLADEYQTVFAKPIGSKAAPTAGLHFTEALLEELSKSHDIEEITLHVGLGTFSPLTDEQMKSRQLHAEHYEVSPEVLKSLQKAEHVTAVGTTSARTLETLARDGFRNLNGATDIFIQPGDSFQRVDSLITNFHLPGTSLLMLVEAFIGSEAEMKRVYDHAIREKYRFYSFGDAMLII